MTATPIAPMPDPTLVRRLVSLGFSYFRSGGTFTLLDVDGSRVFLITAASWAEHRAAVEENLEHSAAAALRRRRR